MSLILETYEWDNTWIEKTAEKNAKRVLYIGDSISCGTRTEANKISAGEVVIDGFGTSKALDNTCFFPSVSLFAKQEPYRNAVIFNNGLHGWHIDEKKYSQLYEEFLDKLINEFPSTPIAAVLTTFVTNPDYHNDRVLVRNELASEIARKKNIPVIDLYSVSHKNKDLLLGDGVHFSCEGYGELAKAVLAELKCIY
ncbi:MAG: SGNH/GDSL hydrolase family protein [Clostridia bacterium]|nr:SGNH/GDSL hydrolase family protein [Clostridia bacterium]